MPLFLGEQERVTVERETLDRSRFWVGEKKEFIAGEKGFERDKREKERDGRNGALITLSSGLGKK